MRNGSSAQLLLQRSRHSLHLLALRSFLGPLSCIFHLDPVINQILHCTTHVCVVAGFALSLKPLVQWIWHCNCESFEFGFFKVSAHSASASLYCATCFFLWSLIPWSQKKATCFERLRCSSFDRAFIASTNSGFKLTVTGIMLTGCRGYKIPVKLNN